MDNRYIFQPTLELGRDPHLLGYPVVLCDEMPSLQSEGAHPHILFGNLNEAYQIVDRHDIAVMRDPYSHKPYVEFYVTKRVGGALINSQALKGLRCDQPQE